MKNQKAKLIVYTATLLIVLYVFQWLTALPVLKLSTENGEVDLSSYDLSEELVKITGNSWSHYPYELLEPEDFLYKNPTASVENITSDYGTFLLRLKLIPGQTYSVTGKSFHFSQNVYIDGKLIDEVGTPGVTRNETVPKSKTYVYSFAPESDSTDIIVQASSFHHRQGTSGRDFIIGESELIYRYQSLENIRAGMVFGLLITIFFYYIGMYLFLKSKKQFLYLALSALTTAIRLSLTGQKHLVDVFPDISWFLSIRLEYISNILFAIFFLLFFVSLFPKLLPKPVIVTLTVLLGFYGVFVLFADTVLFSSLVPIFTTLWVISSLITFFALTKRLKGGGIDVALMFVGLLIFLFSGVYDELSYMLYRHARLNNTMIFGVAACIFMNMLALTIGFSKTEHALGEAEEKKAELDKENQFLERLNQTRKSFMATFSHEMKTPLTVMSVNAQLSQVLLGKGVDEEINQYLDGIANESGRLGRMVSGVLELGSIQDNAVELAKVDMKEIISKSAEAFLGLAARNDNQLTFEIADELHFIFGNADLMTQVLINLLTNANRHTHKGMIQILAVNKEEYIMITIQDNGDGISPELIDHIFERHVHDGNEESKGIGLSLCRTIVEMHHGEIGIHSVVGEGTTVWYTIPISDKDWEEKDQ